MTSKEKNLVDSGHGTVLATNVNQLIYNLLELVPHLVNITFLDESGVKLLNIYGKFIMRKDQ